MKQTKQKETLSVLVPVKLPFNLTELVQSLERFFPKTMDIVFLHVVDSRVKSSLDLIDPKKAEKNFATIKENSEKSLKEAIDPTKYHSMVVEGLPFLEITKLAKDLKVDLIVMNSKSTGKQKKIEDFLFGSTTERVIRTSTIPVFCLPE
jgi:nucleotide-binding universal stress UspA family protein